VSDFLLELRCEEIPARMQAGARAELEKLFRRELDAVGVAVGDLTIWSTPRRLALIARGLPLATEAVSEEAKGPPEGAPDAAIDGFCRKAGVARDQLELRDVKGRMTYFAVIEQPGRAMADVLAAAIPAIIRDFSWPKSMRWGAASIATGSLRWVRPLSGIVALLDGEVVACEVDGIASERETAGHRFHHEGPITIGSADDYAEKLRACHVIVDHEERAAIIRDGATQAAADAGFTLVADDGLVIENAGLTEWPVPLLGRFDEAFLEVPPEVIQLTARVNQKYFVCEDSAGKLANAFICTANIDALDPAVVVDGNRKVLAARLSDARFFWEQDQKKTLAEHAKGLERITFHEKLGTVADKVDRVAKLARWLVEEGIILPGTGRGTADVVGGGGDLLLGAAPGGEPPPSAAAPLPPPRAGEDRARLADMAEQAARLCKADLVTEMVGEFPELQGLMGGYYAAKEGLPSEVAEAIRDHYKPVGQGDDVPTAPVTVAVSLADKLDTLFCFFAIDEKPTGSKDPFALRRSALGVVSLLVSNNIRLPIDRLNFVQLSHFIWSSFDRYQRDAIHERTQKNNSNDLDAIAAVATRIEPSWYGTVATDLMTLENMVGEAVVVMTDDIDKKRGNDLDLLLESAFTNGYDVLDFFADRLKVQQREAGVRHDLIDAVFALGGEDDLVRLLARVHALQAFITTPDGANLLAGYKRAANILKKENYLPRDGEGDRPKSGGGDSAASAGIGGKSPPSAAAPLPPPRIGEGAALSYTPEPAEKALIDALAAAAPRAAEAVAAERFADAMTALATLRAPIDTFFEDVIVNADEADKRAARLALLARFRDAVHRVADFSRIEG